MKFSFIHSIRWSIFIFMVTFITACMLTTASTIALEGLSWGAGTACILLLICAGIAFDILGTAAASAREARFHAMASKRVRGARHAARIARNAERVSYVCSGVIGDITAVVSGTASALVIFKLMAGMGAGDEAPRTAVIVLFTALVSGLTAGGRAMGKSLAAHHSTAIMLIIGKFLYILEHRLGITWFYPKRKKSKQGKRGNKRAARTNQSA
ncbi:hypothetical protein N0M98_15870 [Paenibacillus doosanensis]|uniref:hypothetical protein n=1 Tax=Paenibacillus doosanensis TaxID=1229154 RepID=UPI00217F9C11|nr:hypothetical protein [Paenibacillus doosanensis]MCS7461631.1 hypothetical protein [Paenibacillus doosanensis]